MQGPAGNSGPKGDKGDPTPLPITMNGFYLLPDGGYVELLKDNGDLYDVLQGRLIVKNADNSFGILPISIMSNIPLMSNKLLLVSNLTFAAPNNVKADVGNTILVGSYLTMLVFEMVNDKLKVTIQISNTNTVLFSKVIENGTK
jgi:hypothetical protein